MFPLGHCGALRMYWVLPNKSAATGVLALFFFISSAQVALAPSTCFMFAMQAFFWLAARAFTKLGIAIAASKPMMATTIMISTRVKPDFPVRLIFILSFIFCIALTLPARIKAKGLSVPWSAFGRRCAFYWPHLIDLAVTVPMG